MYVLIGAVVVGITLGLLGSGGSILTVPILVYLVGHSGKIAIAESLAIVGLIAGTTALPYARSNLVDWRSVALFGIPGMFGTLLGAQVAEYLSGSLQLVLFACVMFLAAMMMFRRSPGRLGKFDPTATTVPRLPWMMIAEGLAVGMVTGLVGVGGGFLIIPALVLIEKLPIRQAIGTSLAVIALNSLSGFYKYWDAMPALRADIDWSTILSFVALGIVGSFIGKQIGAMIDQEKLRRGFAFFLVAMALVVIGKETPKLFHGDHPPTHANAHVGATGEGCS